MLFVFKQLFVAPDGGNGSNIEHSAADGVASAQVNAFALDNMYVCINIVDALRHWKHRNLDDLLTYVSPVSNKQLTQAQQLEWNINSESANDIEIAKMNIDRYTGMF